MNKSQTFLLLLMLSASAQTFSQTVQPDSIKKIAATDAEKFKISDENLKKFKAERSKASSDIFKPISSSANNVSLLNDSVYVMAYKQAAHKNTKNAIKSSKKHSAIGTVGYVAGGLGLVALIFLGLNQI